MSSLDAVLSAASAAEPSERIEFRDPIAAHGENAIEAMTEWLGDSRLAAFAIRVLEVIGRDPDLRSSVADVLQTIDREELPAHLGRDVEATLAILRPPRPVGRSGGGGSNRPVCSPGVDGRGYWVMRTSADDHAYIWAEAQRGRLRQGWGWNEAMNLDTIAETLRRGGELTGDQPLTMRARRMRSSEPDGMRVGDIVVAPNLPVWGELSVFRVAGSYEYAMDPPQPSGDRFGHILPVKLLVAAVDRRSPRVSDALRASLRVQTRLYNITAVGGEVERLLGREAPTRTTTGSRQGAAWTEAEYATLFGRFPPKGERPSDDQITALAAELGRSFDAIGWQWQDGERYCSGASASTTSDALKSWLDRTGACGRRRPTPI
ncbi:MAG: hypothetical protein H0V73_09150 [Chloroflexi bacterium]|nr:hypothetical protein [Chloroflexota bacterium]